MSQQDLDALFDRLVAEYSDRLSRGVHVDRELILQQVPEEHRRALARSLRMIEVGLAVAPSGSEPLGPGSVLDGYTILRELGRGGMATVYLAEEKALTRQIALKVLRPALATEPVHLDRFRREGQAVARLEHPNIARIYAVGHCRGYHYLAMEFVAGPTLAEALQRLPEQRPWSAGDLSRVTNAPSLASAPSYRAALAGLLAPVARALSAAHSLGIVHRDVKPSNILLRSDGSAALADFGLAKDEAEMGLSLTGDTIGTPWYMSPEQAHAIEHAVDERTDIYSLGVTLYEALSGRRPYEGESALAVMQAIKSGVPRALSRISPETNDQIDAVVRKAMGQRPEDRYRSAQALEEDLTAVAKQLPTRARAQEGGPLKRTFHNWRRQLGSSGEYRSPTEFLGLPLVHVFIGPRYPGQKIRVAKGWFAMGDFAIGGMAFGGGSLGVVAFGGMSAGVMCIGGMALGLMTLAGISIGVFAGGGMALGWLAFGGLALGHIAIGGVSRGAYAEGGQPYGEPIVWGPEGTFAGTWLGDVFTWAQGLMDSIAAIFGA